MCVSMSICRHVYMYVSLCICIYFCMYVYVCLYMYMHICVHVCLCVHRYVFVYVCICVCMCVCICAYVRLYICMYMCLYVSVCSFPCLDSFKGKLESFLLGPACQMQPLILGTSSLLSTPVSTWLERWQTLSESQHHCLSLHNCMPRLEARAKANLQPVCPSCSFPEPTLSCECRPCSVPRCSAS